MINTRDFFLFVVAVLFLLVFITTTWAHHTSSTVSESLTPVRVVDDVSNYTVEGEVIEVKDRQSTIERIREKIAESTFLDDANPSVEDDTQLAVLEEGQTMSTDVEAGMKSVQLMRCATQDSGVLTLQGWPRENLMWVQSNGIRQLMLAVDENQSIARLTLPLYPVPLAEPICLDSEIIGVTLDGTLIFNGDAIVYTSTGGETLIGYARDGFPIYGQSDATTDQCGGYQAFDGYRYALSQERQFMIGCFKASPYSL